MSHKSAVAALLIVIIISAVALLMAYSASILGIGELDIGYTAQRGGEAFSVADGCVEETLRRITLDSNYGIGAGLINLTVSNGSCTIQVSDLGSSRRRIVVTGTSGVYNKKIETEITLSSTPITIDTWQETTD
ncbi:hypothetical protein MYX06_03210 [Patescibacteria group bacterium AH-259-L05]|nr:hypothetical protein [Patescibacteria group bacterium AH-259-L05]